jgi:hypothetical protein
VPITYPGTSPTGGWYPDSSLVYLEADGTGNGNPYWIMTQSGTTYWLFQGDINTTSWSTVVYNNTSTWYSNPNGTIGSFWILGIYKDPSGVLIATIHNQNADGSGDYNHMALALAKSTDNARSWTILGNIAHASDWTFVDRDIGGTNPVVGGDGYLYVLYNCMSWTCAARAKITDVMSAAALNHVTAWQAWYNGSWTGVPLGGNASAINDPVGYLGAAHSTVSHSLHDGKFYMPANLNLFSSPDLVRIRQMAHNFVGF